MARRFEYDVRIVFEIPESDLDHLISLSGRHYDLTCRSAGRPGFGGFLHGMKNSAEDGVAAGRLTGREVDLVCKILETPGSSDDLSRLFHGFLTELSAEACRVNGLPAVGSRHEDIPGEMGG